MKTILVTGYAGMLGQALLKELTTRPMWRVVGVGRTAANLGVEQHAGDLTDRGFRQELLQAVRPDVIVHAAAIVSIAGCQDDMSRALALHVEAARHFALEVPRTIYVSTDSVFSGGKAPFSEDDPADPVNAYAQSKFLGECAVLANSPEGLAIRTNLFGLRSGAAGNSLAEWAVGELGSGRGIKGYDNIHFNPLDVFSLASVIGQLIEKEVAGLVHVGATDSLSKYDFLVRLAHTFGFPESLIEPLTISVFNDGVPRALNTTLDVSKASGYVSLPTINDCMVSLKNNADFHLHE